MEKIFDQKIALITGASSGIGKATTKLFAEYGCQLLITGRNEQRLAEMQNLLSGYTQVDYLAGDLADRGFRENLVGKLRSVYGQLDILINAAGIIGTGTLESTPLEEYDKMMDINLRSVFHLTQLVLPLLLQRKGNIVNVSSVTGTRAFPGIISYCISKAGLDQMTRAAALELAPKGVRVNAVNPGVVETNLHKNSGMNKEEYAAFLEHSKSTHPLGRVGQPEEVAELIAFLASEKAGWITGGTFNIDGGRHQTCAR